MGELEGKLAGLDRKAQEKEAHWRNLLQSKDQTIARLTSQLEETRSKPTQNAPDTDKHPSHVRKTDSLSTMQTERSEFDSDQSRAAERLRFENEALRSYASSLLGQI